LTIKYSIPWELPVNRTKSNFLPYSSLKSTTRQAREAGIIWAEI